jgi:hypothetical protein
LSSGVDTKRGSASASLSFSIAGKIRCCRQFVPALREVGPASGHRYNHTHGNSDPMLAARVRSHPLNKKGEGSLDSRRWLYAKRLIAGSAELWPDDGTKIAIQSLVRKKYGLGELHRSVDRCRARAVSARFAPAHRVTSLKSSFMSYSSVHLRAGRLSPIGCGDRKLNHGVRRDVTMRFKKLLRPRSHDADFVRSTQVSMLHLTLLRRPGKRAAATLVRKGRHDADDQPARHRSL